MRKVLLAAVLAGGLVLGTTAVFAGPYYLNQGYTPYQNNYRGGPYYADPYYPGGVVIIDRRPIIIERRGSNDALYEYDNVYGPGASAAGRMSRSVVAPQPQFFYAY